MCVWCRRRLRFVVQRTTAAKSDNTDTIFPSWRCSECIGVVVAVPRSRFGDFFLFRSRSCRCVYAAVCVSQCTIVFVLTKILTRKKKYESKRSIALDLCTHSGGQSVVRLTWVCPVSCSTVRKAKIIIKLYILWFVIKVTWAITVIRLAFAIFF